ncbi:DUF4328 domain-containing protein [Nocardia yamanashiensis]|uniref:DUF4328 domain-containing protein n=1 Tax=Nocardia yamanashiensis TaxID=209247 RepID=UPI001E323381|nr:DUF4328 domain-containing protein [Nocardia yamanashiensis]UGT40426.1 DUF4328 domain-containing protein [Nocardia yamanashiensis]
MADSRSAVVQPCARCGARWAVQGKPLHWCPRCHGVLLSPAPVDAPAERRNYRWVARPPGRRSHPAGGPARAAASRETPRYTEIPRWGLRDRPAAVAPEPRNALSPFTDRLHQLLYATIALFVLAAVAELGRYGVLLRNRTRLIHPAVLWASDIAVYATAVLSLVFALATAVALVGWLVRTRDALYAARGQHDPRSPRLIAAGCLIPGVNLIFPGVFLTEAARLRGFGADTATPQGTRASRRPAAAHPGTESEADPRLLQTVRIWWAAWVLNGLLVVISQLYRFADSLQVKADGVLVAMWTNLVAAGVAVLTLGLVRAFAGQDLRGRPTAVTRWLPATAPAQPVIEPVQPADRASDSTGRAPGAAVGNDEATASDSESGLADSERAPESEHEEVLAK